MDQKMNAHDSKLVSTFDPRLRNNNKKNRLIGKERGEEELV
jgi:hypothetical protein